MNMQKILEGNKSTSTAIEKSPPQDVTGTQKKPSNDQILIDSSPQQNFVLSEREAEAASPDAAAVCGEEDPGEGLEFLVTEDISQKNL